MAVLSVQVGQGQQGQGMQFQDLRQFVNLVQGRHFKAPFKRADIRSAGGQAECFLAETARAARGSQGFRKLVAWQAKVRHLPIG